MEKAVSMRRRNSCPNEAENCEKPFAEGVGKEAAVSGRQPETLAANCRDEQNQIPPACKTGFGWFLFTLRFAAHRKGGCIGMEKKNIITLKDIVVSFDGEQVLDHINLSIADGEFVTLLGPSGCGKTTTLRIIGGFVTPDSGDVFFDGKRINDLPAHKRRVNTIFQRYALFPHLNVYENVAFGMRVQKKPNAEIHKTVKRMLEMVNLKGFERRSVNKLSGGQQQRVAIARAMVKKPDILLCDELTGALDTKSSKDVLQRVQKMNDTYKTTVVIITHNLNIAGMADRIIKITDGKVVSNQKNADKKRVEEMEL